MNKIGVRLLSLSLLVLLLLSATLSMPASAAVNGRMAGIYITVGGTCVQDTQTPHTLYTTTTVKKNPDNAWLRTDIELLDGVEDGENENDKEMFWSDDRGVTQFDYTYVMFVTITNRPEIVYCAHNVLGGTESPTGYVYHEAIDVIWP